MCGFVKRNCLGFQHFVPLTESLLVFAAESCGDLYSWHWNRWLWGLGLLAPNISLLNFYPPYVCEGPAYSVSAPSLTSLDGCDFFNSVVVRLTLNLVSDGSE